MIKHKELLTRTEGSFDYDKLPSPFNIGKRPGSGLDINFFSGLSPEPPRKPYGLGIPIRALNPAEVRDLSQVDTGDYTAEQACRELLEEFTLAGNMDRVPDDYLPEEIIKCPLYPEIREAVKKACHDRGYELWGILLGAGEGKDGYNKSPSKLGYGMLVLSRKCALQAQSEEGETKDRLKRLSGRYLRMAATFSRTPNFINLFTITMTGGEQR